MSGKSRWKSSRRSGHKPRSLVLAIIALALLAVVAVGLSAVAVFGPKDASTTTQVTQQAAPIPSAEPLPEAEPAPVASAADVQRFLVAGEEPGQLMRATAGSCPDPAGVIEVSFDGGREWLQATTADVASTQILQLDAASASLVRFVSLKTDCTPQISRSFVGGVDWEPADPSIEGWYVDPADNSRVSTPTGVLGLPCAAAGLSSSGANGIVLCTDQAVTTSVDGGASWSEPAAVPGAAAVGASPSGFIVASSAEAECDGVRTRTLNDGVLSEPGACVEVNAADGNLAVALRDGSAYLWAAETFLRSTDTGVSWG